MTPKHENTNAHDRILDAAAQIFCKEGYDGVSVRELTDAAGVNVAAINYHFGGKRNLYLEVLRRTFVEMAEHKRQTLQSVIDNQPTPDLTELLTTYVDHFIGNEETAAETRQFLQLVSRELSNDSDAMNLLLQELMLPIHQLMKSAIGKAKPDLSEEKISLCISSTIGQVFHFVRCPDMLRTLAGRADDAGWLSVIRNHVIEFSLKGLDLEKK